MLAALPALIAMLAVQILISFSSQTAPVLTPLAAPAIGFDPVWVGYYVGVSYGCAATAGLISGNFIARYGAIRTSQVCLGFCALGMALAASGMPVLVGLSAVALGFGYGPVTPSSSHILARVSPPGSVNLIFSIKQAGVPLGSALAGALAPSLALAFGWQTACLIVGTCALTLALVIQPFREGLDATRDRDRAPFAFRRSAAVLAQIWRLQPVRRLAASSLAFSGMQACASTFLVVYLNDRVELPIVTAGLLLSVMHAGGVVGRILWGIVADRSGKPIAVLGGLGFAMSICAGLVAAFGAAWPTLVIGLVVFAYGATAIAWNGVFLAQIARLAPDGKAGEITGGTSFFTFGGVLIVPSLFSAILGATDSYAVAFGLAAFATFVAGAVHLDASRSGLSGPAKGA